ncbi:MAG: RluA family pseudouridine synthase, partial [Anaerolineae bacterium]|nr:RluA family pseudouridine synthase [Anaerolineae bacterium]
MDERLVELRFDSPQQERLDHFLVENLPEFSRSRLQGMIKNELVTVNGEIAKKTGLKLGQGAQISVRILQSQPTDLQPEA